MKAEIGGYFELELPEGNPNFLHSDGVLLNSGRHALEFILMSFKEKPRKVWLPGYTCETILQPFERLGINYCTYDISENLEMGTQVNPELGEYIIANNYFGIKDAYMAELSQRYGNKLIIDQSQAWYANPEENTYSFYSPRKFFGLPDGGVATGVQGPNADYFPTDHSSERFGHLLKRHEKEAHEGYSEFKANSLVLSSIGVQKMSPLTRRLLSIIDMEAVKNKRLENFSILAKELATINSFQVPEIGSFECPMVYPFRCELPGLRNYLIENKVFVATYWPNILNSDKVDSSEKKLSSCLLPLPVDQRYGKQEMKFIISLIFEFMEQTAMHNTLSSNNLMGGG